MTSNEYRLNIAKTAYVKIFNARNRATTEGEWAEYNEKLMKWVEIIHILENRLKEEA